VVDVIHCYRLARFYHVSPTVFLDMPMSEIRSHLDWTNELAVILNRERDSDDNG